MPSTTNYNRGDVVLVPFPFTDLTTSKQRPALVVSADNYNATRRDVVVVAITSQLPAVIAADEYEIGAPDLAACGLPKSSLVKLSKVVTLHQQLVVKRMGRMPAATLAQIPAQLREFFS